MLRSTERKAGAGLLWLIVVAAAGPRSEAQDGRPPGRPRALPTARGAIEPAAPVLPGDVVAAMQEARYEEARRALTALAEHAANADDRAYLAYLRAVAERLAGNRDAARATLKDAMRAAPANRWAAKIRYELAGVELAAGNLAEAEALTRAEAGRLLAPDRKDGLAEVYHAFAIRLLEPGDPWSRPTRTPPMTCSTRRATWPRARAPGPVCRGHEPGQPGGQQPRRGAIQDCEAYLKDFADGVRSFRASGSGWARRSRRSTRSCRPGSTWSDLARDIERLRPAELTPGAGRHPGVGAVSDRHDVRHAQPARRHAG